MRHGRAYGHGHAVPIFCPRKLDFAMLSGLNALKFWLDFKSLGELGSVELDVQGSKWSGRMKGYEGVSKWKITNSKFKLKISL